MNIKVYTSAIKMVVFFTAILAGFSSYSSLNAQTSITSMTIGTQTAVVTYGTAATVNIPISFTTTGSGAGTAEISIAWTAPTGVTALLPITINPATQTNPFNITINSAVATPAGVANYVIYALSNPLTSNLTANASGTFTVTPKVLTLASPAAANKVYDGTTAATITGTLTGIVGNDLVTLAGTGTFASATVANAIAVVSACTLGGAQAANYTLTQPTGLTANITAKPLTVTSPVAANKVYDHTNSTTITGILAGIVAPDVVTLIGTGTFASVNVANAIVVTSTSTLAGANSTNYMLTQPVGLTANITPKPITLTGVTGVNKVYNGTTAGSVAGTPVLVGVETADVGIPVVVGGAAVAVFADALVGTAKPLSVTGYTLTGSASANYALAQPTGLLANITPVGLTISGLTGANKVYDGTTGGGVLTGTAVLSAGVITADVPNVILGGSPVVTYATAAVAPSIALAVTGYALTGSAAGNYTVSQPTGLTGGITPRPITIAGLTGVNKVYDQTLTGSVTGTAALAGVVTGDVANVVLSGTAVASFASSSVATGIALSVTGFSISGTAAGSYTLIQPTVLTANITPKPVTLTGLTGGTRFYDGTTAATTTGSATILSGVLTGDNVVLTGTPTGVFANSSVESNKVMTITGYSLIGTAAGNYSIATYTITGEILTRWIYITSPAAISRPYNASRVVTITGTLQGVFAPDDVTLVGSGVTESNGAGIGLTVTSNCTLVGAQAPNYAVVQPEGLTVTISTVPLIVAATDPAKIFGTALQAGPSTTGFTSSGLIGSEVISSVDLVPSVEGLTPTTPAGSVYTVAISSATGTNGFVISNYLITYVPFTGMVLRKPITITTTPGQRKLIGTNDPLFTYSFAPSLVGADTFSGSLSRVAGETVEGSPYAYTLGTLTAGLNYELTLAAGSFAITSSSEALITAFSFDGEPYYPETITQTANGGTISVPVRNTANLTSLIANFKASPGAVVTSLGAVQHSGFTANNFSAMVYYIVTSANGSVSKTYSISVVRNGLLTDKQILTFGFVEVPAAVTTIVADTVKVNVPFTLSLTSLRATYTLSNLASAFAGGVLQTSGITVNDFTAAATPNGLLYVIQAENQSTRIYHVKIVREAPRTGKQLIAFSVAGISGAVNELDHTVSVSVPAPFDIAHAVATFSASYLSTVKIGTVLQTSGVSINSFVHPVVYTVTAENGVVQNYTVTVVVNAGPSGKDFFYFAFEDFNPDVNCYINQATGQIFGTVPLGTNLGSLKATFLTNSPLTTVSIPGMGFQQSGITVNDFRLPVSYLVTASDATTKSYTVSITLEPDITIPVVTNAAQTVTNLVGQFVLLRSSESVGKVYIILSTAIQATVANLEAAVAAGSGRTAYVTAANTDIPVSTHNLRGGTYYTYAIDAVGNKSLKGINSINVTDLTPPTVSVATQTLTNAMNHTVAVTSSDEGLVYLILDGEPQASQMQLNAAVSAHKGAKGLVQTPNVPVDLSVYLLPPGNYHAYAVDISSANNMSARSANVVTITEASRIKSILAFSFNQLDPPAIGQIIGTDINLHVRVGTPLTSLVATFIISPLSHVFVNLNEQISGVTPNDFSSPVSYVVFAEDGSSLAYTVTVEFNTGIDDKELMKDIVTYPNPVTTNLHIESAGILDRIVILNSLGQTVEDISSPGQSSIQIPTDSWTQGIYFVRYYSERKYIGVQKVIKN